MRTRVLPRLAAAALVPLLAACGGITPRGQVPQGDPGPHFNSPLPVASRAPGTITDGVWNVPGEVGYGIYKTTVPALIGPCFWERRTSPTDTSVGAVIANGLVDSGKVATIEIKLGDQLLETENCGTWKRIK